MVPVSPTSKLFIPYEYFAIKGAVVIIMLLVILAASAIALIISMYKANFLDSESIISSL